MAYNVNLPAGTYHARALQADTYPTKNGEGLMLGVEWLIDNGEYEGSQITSRTCLIDNSGSITKNYESVREWAKTWDGVDTGYFRAHFSEWEVQIVTERKIITVKDENGMDVQKEIPDVKYINDPNAAHGAKIESGDQKQMGAKFGAKLRAAAGQYKITHPGVGAPTSRPAVAAAPKPAPVATAPVPPPAEPPTAPAVSVEEMKRKVWTAFCERHPDLAGEARNAAFFELVATVTPEKDYAAIDFKTWNDVLEKLLNDLPF